MKKGLVVVLFVISIFAINFVVAEAIGNSLHLNIQTTNSTGIATGTFAFGFNISTTSDCAAANVVYADAASLTTSDQGIISHYLDNVNLNFSEQYWLCYYRNNALISSSKIARTPYSFMSKNTTASGLKIDSDLNLGDYGLSTGGGWLGNGVSIIGGAIYAQTGYFYNITSLNINNLNINGSLFPHIDNFLNLGSALFRWKDLYLSGDIHSDGTLIINSGTDISTWEANVSRNWTADGSGLYAPNTTVGIQYLINDSGVYSTYNATYDNYAYNVSLNHTNIVFTNWNSTWDNNWLTQMLSTNDTSINSTYNIGVLYNETASMIANLSISQLGVTTGSLGWNRTAGNVFLNYPADKVGIGTLTPSQTLDVRGQGNFSGVIYYNNNTLVNSTFFTSMNNTATIGQLYNVTASMIANLSISQSPFYYNHTLSTYNTWNDIWSSTYNSSYDSFNSTLNIQNLYNTTASMIANLSISQSSLSNYWGSNGSNIYNETALVGIGTIKPLSKLDVTGTGDWNDAGSSRISLNNTVAKEWKILSSNLGQFDIFLQDGTSKLTLFNGTDISAIFLNGNVGIGTSSPAYLLEIAKSSKALNVSGNLYANSSNVGIGTSNPEAKLEIANPSAGQETLSLGRANGVASIVASSVADGGSLVLDSNGGTLNLNNYVSDNVILTNGGGYVGVAGANAPAYRLEIAKSSKALNVSGFLYVNSTNIGIGTNDIASWSTNYRALEFPSTSIMFRKTAASDDIYFNSNAYYDGTWKRKIADEVAMISMGNGIIGFNVAANGAADSEITWIEGMRINQSNGFVGIWGATSPKSALSVGSNGSSSTAIYAAGAAVGVYGSGTIYDFQAANGKIWMDSVTAVGTDPMCWDGIGVTLIGDCSSLTELKENINNLSINNDFWNNFMNLRPVNYNWKNSEWEQDIQTGFLAEEVEAINPIFADYAGVLNKETNETTLELRGVNFNAITTANVLAIQDLKRENEALKTENTKLKDCIINSIDFTSMQNCVANKV